MKELIGKPTRDYVSDNMASWKDQDAVLVTGIFKNIEKPGAPLSFAFKAYPGDQLTEYYFQHGMKYTIPKGVARHINRSCFYFEYQHLRDQAGDLGIRQMYCDAKLPADQQMATTKKVHRFEFVPLDFNSDDLDFQQAPELYSVKAISKTPAIIK